MDIKKILKDHQDWLNGDGGECANLRGANLRYADLRGADLRGADLIVISLPIWTVFIHKGTIRIGCKHFSYNEWDNFTDAEISNMDSQALEWWKTYKPMIMAGVATVGDE